MHMEISYQRTHLESYMVVKKEMGIPDYQERMLKENEITSLLPFYTMQLDGRTQFWHDISGKQSLKDYVEQERISLSLLERILTCMILAFEELEKFLIQQQNILLRPDTIYLSRQDRIRIFLCYCPQATQGGAPMFTEMMEYMVGKVSGGEEPLVHLCYQLYELSLRPETTLQEMHGLVEKEIHSQMDDAIMNMSDAVAPIMEEPQKTENISVEKEDIYYVPTWERVLHQVCRKGQQLLAMITGWGRCKENDTVGEDFIIEPMPELSQPTQLLFQGQRQCRGQLLYQGTKQEKDYTITKDTFRVGHEEAANDACLSSDAVSHFHAKITRQGEEYFIEDLNSTNGTYVNGEQLCYTQKRRLETMDRIQFADVSYMFL